MVLLLAGFYYLNNGRLVPRFLLQGRPGTYWTLVVLLFVIYIVACGLAVNQVEHVRSLHRPARFPGPMPRRPFMQLLPAIIFFAVIVLWSTVQAYSAALQRMRESREASERSLIQVELDQLRAQIDPHFFFNALNTIYGLAELKDERTARATHDLGRLMRHTLEAPRDQLIPLADEVEHLKAYVAFQQLRSTGAPARIAAHGIEEGMRIAPLLFIPLVENAFKHGSSTPDDDPTEIIIAGGEDGSVTLSVENTLRAEPNTQTSGLGLANLRRRLSLEYPTGHSLFYEQAGSRFKALLRIELDHAVHSA